MVREIRQQIGARDSQISVNIDSCLLTQAVLVEQSFDAIIEQRIDLCFNRSRNGLHRRSPPNRLPKLVVCVFFVVFVTARTP